MQKRGLVGFVLLILVLSSLFSFANVAAQTSGDDEEDSSATPLAKTRAYCESQGNVYDDKCGWTGSFGGTLCPTPNPCGTGGESEGRTVKEICLASYPSVCCETPESRDSPECEDALTKKASGETTASTGKFVESDSQKVYDSMSTCLKSGKTSTECWPIMQEVWTKWAEAQSECLECTDQTCYTPEKGNFRIVGCDPSRYPKALAEIELAANAAIEDFQKAQEVKQPVAESSGETAKKESKIGRWFRNLFGRIFSRSKTA